MLEIEVVRNKDTKKVLKGVGEVLDLDINIKDHYSLQSASKLNFNTELEFDEDNYHVEKAMKKISNINSIEDLEEYEYGKNMDEIDQKNFIRNVSYFNSDIITDEDFDDEDFGTEFLNNVGIEFSSSLIAEEMCPENKNVLQFSYDYNSGFDLSYMFINNKDLEELKKLINNDYEIKNEEPKKNRNQIQKTLDLDLN